MFEDIIGEINTFPLSDIQKEYIKTSLNVAYSKGKKDGAKDTAFIINSSEKEDQKLL